MFLSCFAGLGNKPVPSFNLPILIFPLVEPPREISRMLNINAAAFVFFVLPAAAFEITGVRVFNAVFRNLSKAAFDASKTFLTN